jgi:hypothetical protein
MNRMHGSGYRAALRAVLFLGLCLCHAGWLLALPQQSRPVTAPSAKPSATGDEELSATRDQLFQLLRLSPKLTSVVARDPSLLANQDYVTHNNPELAQFLQQHPEIARNPEFRLFLGEKKCWCT